MEFKVRRLHGLIAAACGFALPAALAQTTLAPVVVSDTAEQAGSYDTPVSRSATKIPAAQRDIPQIVNVVTQPLLREQNASSVQDALQNVTGLSFSVGDGQRDQVTIRGFSAINDQFVDGLRDDALYFRDLSNVERIEVLKGPGSVLYGRGSAGGIVNRITKKPRAEPRQELGLTVGSEGQKRGEFDLGLASAGKGALFRLTGAVEDSEGFRNQYFLERKAVAPSASFRLGADTTLTAQADYLKDKRLADQGVPRNPDTGRPVDVPIETYYGAANGRERAFVQSEVTSATLSLDHRFSSELSFHSAARHHDYSLDRNYTTIGNVRTGARPSVTINQVRRLRDESGYSWQNELTQKLAVGGTQHQILYGVELGRQSKSERLFNNRNVATYNLFDPVLATLGPMPAIAASNDNRTRIETAALYLQDLAELGSRWKVLGGVRYDQLKQRRDDLTRANIDLERTDKSVSPRLGAVFRATDSTSLYAAYSRSFQPISDQFVFYRNSDDLKPLETTNREVGAKFDVSSQASASIALFEMTQSNVQVADPANPGAAMPAGSQTTRGLELGWNGALAPDWELAAGYAYMSSEVRSPDRAFDGKEGALTPRHGANLWLKRQLGGGYYVAGGGRAEASRYASPSNSTQLPGYGVLNLAGGYQGRAFEVNVTLRNLLDRKYFVSAHSGADDYNMPGEPRTLTVSTRMRF